MKSPLLILGALFLAGCAATGARNESMNSIQHMLIPSSTAPTVVFRILFRTGSSQDPAGKEGLAHLTAALVARGGSESHPYKDLLRELYPMAGSIDYHCDKEVTTFIGEVPAEKVDDFYALFREIFLAPRFAPEDFERLKEDQVNFLENTLRGNNDEEFGKWALQTAIYANHPYGHVDQGTVETVQALTLEDVRQFYADYYTQKRVTVGLAGRFDEDFGEEVVLDFTSLPQGDSWARVERRAPLPEGHQFLLVEKEAPATAISIGFPLEVTRRDEDFYALMIANSAFGEHRTFNGRLMNHMRGLRGMNYGDYSYLENFIQDGGSTFPIPNIFREEQYFSIWIRPVPHRNRLFAIRQAIRELKMLIDRGLEPEEFEATKKFLLNYSNLWVQTLSRQLGYALDGPPYGTKSLVEEIQKRMPSITREQVHDAVKRHLQYENLWIAVITKDAEKLKEAIESGNPSPMHYDTEGTPAEVLAEDKEIEIFPFNEKRAIHIIPVGQMFQQPGPPFLLP